MSGLPPENGASDLDIISRDHARNISAGKAD
jgi:hypothetical protein